MEKINLIILKNTQKTFIFISIVFYISYVITNIFENNLLSYIISFLLIIGNIILLYIYSKFNITKLTSMQVIFYFFPVIAALYFNYYENIFDLWRPETYFEQIEFYKEYYFTYYLILILEFIYVCLSFGLFNIFWVARYNKYSDLDNDTNSKWKRYNLVARVNFSILVNLGFLTYTYDFIDFLDLGFSGLNAIMFYFVIASFNYLIFDWFAEVLRSLSTNLK